MFIMILIFKGKNLMKLCFVIWPKNLFDHQYQAICCENEDLKKENEDLKKENEGLKKENEDIRNEMENLRKHCN